jgi:hypothetical protein
MRQKEKGAVIFIVLVIVLLIGVLLAVGYFFFLKPRMQFRKGTQPDTTLETESIIPRTKIEESGMSAKLIISPSQNDIISGEVTIEAVSVPEETENAGFLIVKNFDESRTGGPNLGFDSSGNGGWTKTLDTTEYDDGEYYIGVVVFGSDTDSDPIGVANAKVLIDNSSRVGKESDSTSVQKTKIVESGYNTEIEIAPSKDRVISGDVTITANDVSEEAGVVGFVLTENKDDLAGGTILGFDSSPKGGWTKTLDTTEHDNGKYYIHIFVAEEVGADPIGSASVRVEIKN